MVPTLNPSLRPWGNILRVTASIVYCTEVRTTALVELRTRMFAAAGNIHGLSEALRKGAKQSAGRVR